MKDRENVLRWLDEVDNMVMIMDQAVLKGNRIDPGEARNRHSRPRASIR